MKLFRPYYLATVYLVVRGAAVVCFGSRHASSANVSGVYRISDVRATTACSPNKLPGALLHDSTGYAHLRSVVASRSSLFEVEESGNTISVTPLDSSGHRVNVAALHGTMTGTTGLLEIAVAPRMESPRDAGHMFSVSERGTGTIRFAGLVATPTRPGQGTVISGMVAQIVESDTFSFREGDVAGAVFTTCVLASRVAANRM